MKHCFRLFVSLMAGAYASFVIADESIVLGIGDWAPYTSEDKSRGYLMEQVVTLAFQKEGIKVSYQYLPWRRSYINTAEGVFDGTFPWTKTKEREADFYANNEPILIDDSVIFHLKEFHLNWETISDLRVYKIGLTLGYEIEAGLKGKGLNFETASSEELNFKKLLAGRIDLYAGSKQVGYANIKKNFSPQQADLFTHHPRIISQNEYFVLFSKKSNFGNTLVQRFDAGLSKIKRSGEYARILTGVNLKNIEQKDID